MGLKFKASKAMIKKSGDGEQKYLNRPVRIEQTTTTTTTSKAFLNKK